MGAIASKEIEQPSAIALNFLSQKILWYLVLTYYNKLSHNCFYSGRSQFDTALVAVIKKAALEFSATYNMVANISWGVMKLSALDMAMNTSAAGL